MTKKKYTSSKIITYYSILILSIVFFSLGYHWIFMIPIALLLTFITAWVKGNQFQQQVGGIEMKGPVVVIATFVSQFTVVAICFFIGKLIASYLLN